MYPQTPLTISFAGNNIGEILKGLRVGRIHSTYGTFTAPADKIVPRLLASFEYVSQNLSRPEDTFLIALRSDKGLDRAHFSETFQPLVLTEKQMGRAHKIAAPLQAQNPRRNIIVVFYDSKTPEKLFDNFAKHGIGMVSLYESDCGTNPDNHDVSGAHHFAHPLAFTLPGDDPSAMPANARVIRLTEREESSYGPFVSGNGELLFPLAASLQKYGPKVSNAPRGAMIPAYQM